MRVVVCGVGMTNFVKPGAERPYPEMAAEAGRAALADAGVDYGDVNQVYAGYAYGDSTSGQAAVYRLGLTGVPVINVNNNCATGSTALFLARQAIESGAADCVLALGFEQMRPGAIGDIWTDRPSPFAAFLSALDSIADRDGAALAPFMFGAAGQEYLDRYDAAPELFAQVAVKARRHARDNERAIFRTALTVDEVLGSPKLYGPITRYQACPPTCGAAAAVLCSDAFARRNGLSTDVAIVAQSMTTDLTNSFQGGRARDVVGYDMARRAGQAVYEQAGLGPREVEVAELHDCFTANEILAYEALGLAGEGEATRFVADGDNTYGGRVVTNPSGGLLAKGHPLGATGLAQCTELVQQLRGTCGSRQVEGARTALQHNLGLGGACVVTLYQRG